ncbi:RNA-directed DNA polymerase, eukaryota [Tanacetum coccineum]
MSSVTSSLRRPVRGGSESSQLSLLQEYIEGTILSSLEDRWVWDLNGEGVFCVKDVRNLLDDVFLPKAPIATRWIKYVPIKLNVFAWKVHLNRLPTRVNLQHRGVLVSDPSCPICHSEDEDLAHLFFRCSLVTDIVRLVCRWWNIAWASIDSYSNWLHWFNAIRLSPKVKDLLEGVFYITGLQIPLAKIGKKMAGLFDKQAEEYLDARPTYPAEWDCMLADRTSCHTLAWDVGIGNGQAAIGEAEHYKQVIGTDISEPQLKLAKLHPRVRYLHTVNLVDEYCNSHNWVNWLVLY